MATELTFDNTKRLLDGMEAQPEATTSFDAIRTVLSQIEGLTSGAYAADPPTRQELFLRGPQAIMKVLKDRGYFPDPPNE